jgi:hypothetical protein
MPNFEVFDRKAKPRVTQPLVTLQSAGTFSLNEASFEALGEPDEVELLYDPGEQIVGFRPAGETSPHSYPIKPQPNGRTYQTGGRAFCSHYGIETGTARRFAGEVMGDILAIDLKGEAKIVGRNGRSKQEA